MDAPVPESDSAPTTPAIDVREERERLLHDVAPADAQDALDLVEQVAHLTPLAHAYRAVDRRLALGFSVDEAGRILLGDPNPPAFPGDTYADDAVIDLDIDEDPYPVAVSPIQHL